MEVLIAIVAAVVGGALVWWITRKPADNSASELTRKIELLENTFKNVNDMTLKQLSDIKSDVTENLKSNRETIDSSSRSMHENIRSFTESITKMESNLKNVHESIRNSSERMSSFQDMFKTPKLRGQWGESNLKYELEQTYSPDRVLKQHYFKSGEAVDFAIKLPNDLLLPIDSKFPMDVFRNYCDEESPSERIRKQQVFIHAVRKEVDSVAAKYINPEEATVDFALIYVPAEAVFYEIMFSMKDEGLMDYAYRKKVRFVSPNTLRMTLSVIEHWVRDITVNKETREILKRLGTILQDGKKLSDSFRILGKHIGNVQTAYSDSGDRLRLLTGRVENVISIGEKADSSINQPLLNSSLAEDR